MKLNVLFVFAMVFIQAQTYKFDYFLKYVTSDDRTNSERTLQFFVDSKGSGNELLFTKTEKETLVTLLVLDESVKHNFKITNTNFPIKSNSFIYVDSQKLSGLKNEDKRRFFKSEILLENNEKDVFKIKEFKSDKYNKLRAEAIVEMIPFESNLSVYALVYLFDYQNIYKKIKFDKSYIMKSGEIKFQFPGYGEITSKIKLINMEKQSTEVVLDKSKIKYKKNYAY